MNTSLRDLLVSGGRFRTGGVERRRLRRARRRAWTWIALAIGAFVMALLQGVFSLGMQLR